MVEGPPREGEDAGWRTGVSVIRILYTIPNFITAGSGGAMLEIVRRLDRNVFAPAVCVSRKGGKLDRMVEEMGIPFLEAAFQVPAKPYVTLPVRVWRAAAPFRSFQFDLWHSFHYGDDYTEALIAKAAGARAWVYTKKNMNWRGRAWKVRSLLAGGIAAQNTRMLEEFFGGLWQKKITLIPRGVDTEKFAPGVARRLRLRERFGIAADEPVAVAVGHVLPVKGHELLVRAAAGVPGLHVWIAGGLEDAACVERLRAVAAEAGLGERLRLLGKVDDIAALHAEADVFVHPGRQEGCPVALLEAMACGKACIGTRIAGTEDVIEDGRSGVLVEPLNAEALREAVRRVLADRGLRARLEEGARRRILEGYTIEREVKQHEEFYLRVLQRHSGQEEELA